MSGSKNSTAAEKLYYIPPAAASGVENMAIDRELMQRARREGKTFFRLYHWQPSCISLGRGQDPEKVLNMAYIKRKGYDVVMRPTGGSYVLHHGDITYAIATAGHSKCFALPLLRFYRVINQAFYRALRDIGVAENTMHFGAAAFRREHKQKPCFSHHANHEILINGKKILGSAQRRSKDALLQHGSLLVDDSINELFYVQKHFSDSAAIHRRVTYLRAHIPVSYTHLTLPTN